MTNNISHTQCEHPSTSSARAKCRRARAKGGVHTEQGGASVVEVDFSKAETKKSSTPRDKERACMVCGVEPFTARGHDEVNGQYLYVGDKCFYMIKRDPDFQLWDAKERRWVS